MDNDTRDNNALEGIFAQDTPGVQRNYKDTVFRMVYRDKDRLLELFNALNDTSYDDPDELLVFTLDNAIFMNVKNDVSILLNSVLSLFEQQASVNPNIPLRDLIYVTRQFEKYIVNKSVYSSKLLKLPEPKFIVFYNGTTKQPEKQVLRLSDAFQRRTGEPELELIVTMYNINPGYNKDLMKRCKTLWEYSTYVERVRHHAKSLPLEKAVSLSVDECIEEGVLADFLRAQKAEVIAMSIFEYNEETELKKIREDEYELGRENGLAEGKKLGLEEGRKLGHEDGLEEGRKLGLEEGMKPGAKALLEIYYDRGLTKEAAVKTLSEKLGLSIDKAEKLAEMYFHA